MGDVKQKAIELGEKFQDASGVSFNTAVKLAIICVEEMLKAYPAQCPKDSYEMEQHLFWKEVLNELKGM